MLATSPLEGKTPHTKYCTSGDSYFLCMSQCVCVCKLVSVCYSTCSPLSIGLSQSQIDGLDILDMLDKMRGQICLHMVYSFTFKFHLTIPLNLQIRAFLEYKQVKSHNAGRRLQFVSCWSSSAFCFRHESTYPFMSKSNSPLGLANNDLFDPLYIFIYDLYNVWA